MTDTPAPSITKVFKYPFEPADVVEVDMPAGAVILHCDEQHQRWSAWARVDPSQPMVRRRIRMAGTGHPLDSSAARFINTVVLKEYGLVFHFFEMWS